MKKRFGLAGIIILGMVFTMCKKDSSKYTPKCDGTSATYNSNMKAIIDANCISSGCHPTYNSYSGIQSILSDGSFKSHVLTNQDMPRGSTLSHDQLNQIQCWADAGFPQQ